MATYACSDFHGCYDIYEQIVNSLKIEDTVYFLGDACGRGYYSYKTLCAVLDDPQFVYLMGDQERVLLDCMDAYMADPNTDTYRKTLQNALNKIKAYGLLNTWIDWLSDHNRTYRHQQLSKLMYLVSYVNLKGHNIILTHAGFTPKTDRRIPSDKKLITDTKHINDEWDSAHFYDIFMVHGHMPIQKELHLNTPEDISKYAEGHKIDIDNATYLTGKGILFDLDWFEFKTFYDDKIIKERRYYG